MKRATIALLLALPAAAMTNTQWFVFGTAVGALCNKPLVAATKKAVSATVHPRRSARAVKRAVKRAAP